MKRGRRPGVHRFGEPALLLLLAEGPTHGYELIERLPELIGEERVDMGNLYRALRALEERGFVLSQWREDLPGPTKRVYELTDDGRQLLDEWAKQLARTRERISGFLERYERGRR